MTARFLIGISMRFSGLVFSAFLGLSLAAGAVSAADSSCDSRPLLRIGYIENSFSPSERRAFEATFRYLREKLPQYKFSIDTFLVRDLEKGVGLGQFEFFIGSSGFYRRVFRRGLKDLATLTTPVASDPNEAVATVFMVPKDSPAKTVADLRGMRAAANFELGFTGVFVPLGEIAAVTKGGAPVTQAELFDLIMGGCDLEPLSGLESEASLRRKLKVRLPLTRFSSDKIQ